MGLRHSHIFGRDCEAASTASRRRFTEFAHSASAAPRILSCASIQTSAPLSSTKAGKDSGISVSPVLSILLTKAISHLPIANRQRVVRLIRRFYVKVRIYKEVALVKVFCGTSMTFAKRFVT